MQYELHTRITKEAGSQKEQFRKWESGFAIAIVIGFLLGNCLDGPIVGLSTVGTIVAAWYASVAPYLKRPKLRMFHESARCSSPDNEQDTPSYFVRIAIANVGQTTAKKCKGKLLGVWDSNWTRLTKFDPLNLYWARQDKYAQYAPIDLHGGGDFDYLDIAQVKEDIETVSREDKQKTVPIRLRVVIPTRMKLEDQPLDSPSPGGEPVLVSGEYFLQIAIYCENSGDIEPAKYYKLTCKEVIPTSCKETSPVNLVPLTK